MSRKSGGEPNLENFLTNLAADIKHEIQTTKRGAGVDNKMDLAPLRTLDDFILQGSRFQVPDINQPERWVNRVINNLLYYQTNYFLSAAVIFLVVAFLHPQQMAVGIILMACLFGGLSYLQTRQEAFHRFKRDHPVATFVLGVLTSHYLVYKLGSIAVILLGIALPVTFVLVHASLRLRNVKNKLVNVSEAMGLSKQTPMAIFLRELGIESEIKMN